MSPAGRKGAGGSRRPLVEAWTRAFRQIAGGPGGTWDRGLALLGSGAVGQVHAAPGKLVATVTAAGDTARRAHVALPVLPDETWRRMAERLIHVPGATAEVLAGKMPAALADPALMGGVSLMPAARELAFSCTCPSGRRRGRPCEHGSALGHAVAVRLGASPATLLAARGMAISRLAELLRAGIPRQGPRGPVPDAAGSVRAQQAYALWDSRPAGVGGTAVAEADEADEGPFTPFTPSDDPPAPVPGREDLAWLIRDAARRAGALLAGAVTTGAAATGAATVTAGGTAAVTTGAEAGTAGTPANDDPVTGPAGVPHTELADAVRLLASPGGAARLGPAAAHTGTAEAELRRLLVAYRHGGPAGVDAAAGPLAADPAGVDEAAARVRGGRGRPPGAVEADGNRVTDRPAGVQLRLGPDGRWYPFTAAGEDWRPAAGPARDVLAAYDAARRARLARPAGA